MKLIFFFVAVIGTASANAQSLKDALYSGKLKADTGAVLKKGDSLKIKENMAQKIVDDSIRKTMPVVVAQPAPAAQTPMLVADSTAVVNTDGTIQSTTDGTATTPAKPALVLTGDPVSDNNKVWKNFADSLKTSIQAEVMTSNKVKSGNYAVIIEYEIGVDGQISLTSVSSDPKSSYLEQQLRDRITYNAPQMSPVLTNGKPRVVKKKQVMSFIKQKD